MKSVKFTLVKILKIFCHLVPCILRLVLSKEKKDGREITQKGGKEE